MALSDNCCIAYQNLIPTATMADGTENAAFPATNVQSADLTRPWRTGVVTAPTSSAGVRDTTTPRTWAEFDFGANVTIQLVAIIAHNLTMQAGTILRVQASTAAQNWTTTPFAWDTAYASAPGGTPTDFKGPIFCLAPDPVVARYLRIVLVNSTNPDGFLQIGRIFAGPIWQPSINMDLDWSVGWQDPSEETRTLGGTLLFDRRPPYRVASFTLAHIPETEALANVLDMDRRAGRTKEVIFIPQPNKNTTFLYEAVYGRQRQMDGLRNPYVDLRRARAFEIEEMI